MCFQWKEVRPVYAVISLLYRSLSIEVHPRRRKIGKSFEALYAAFFCKPHEDRMQPSDLFWVLQ